MDADVAAEHRRERRVEAYRRDLVFPIVERLGKVVDVLAHGRRGEQERTGAWTAWRRARLGARDRDASAPMRTHRKRLAQQIRRPNGGLGNQYAGRARMHEKRHLHAARMGGSWLCAGDEMRRERERERQEQISDKARGHSHGGV